MIRLFVQMDRNRVLLLPSKKNTTAKDIKRALESNYDVKVILPIKIADNTQATVFCETSRQAQYLLGQSPLVQRQSFRPTFYSRLCLHVLFGFPSSPFRKCAKQQNFQNSHFVLQ